MRSVLNNNIDDESLKEYFYRGQDNNNKATLDKTASGSYGECNYAESTKDLEKSPKIINLGALGSGILGETLFQVKLNIT